MIKYKICPICSENFYVGFFYSHLNKVHNISRKDYYIKYESSEEHICPVCGKEIPWNGKSFNKFCSSSCANSFSTRERIKKNPKKWNNPEKTKKTNFKKYGHISNLHCKEGIEKKKETWKLKYGSEHPMKSEICKTKAKQTKLEKYGDVNFNNQEKIKKTCLEKYGVINVFQNEKIKTKAKQTKLEKYGDENYSNHEKAFQTTIERFGGIGNASSEILQKYKETCVKKYGVDSFSKTEMFRNFMEEKSLVSLRKVYPNVLQINKPFVLCYCDKCKQNFEIRPALLLSRFRNKEEICTNCNKIFGYKSKPEKDLVDLIKNLGINCVENDRTILCGRELDIYIPEKKLAIEYDGLFWHSELYKKNNYHLQKTEECERKGIQLIHIFENEWINKKEIVESRIRGLLGLNERIFARKCECKQISYNESNNFLDINHIQGNCVSKYRYGLFYNGELVSVMTFGKSRFANEFELLRFANKLNTNVIGGASKLFQHFLKEHPEIKEIVSYADRRWSKGNLYEKIGFQEESKTAIGYYYTFGNELHNRIEFQKHKLVAEGADPNKTEHEIMLDRGYYRIYDCGNLKYKYIKED